MTKNKKEVILSLKLAYIAVRLIFILAVFNLVSCGKNCISWPAKIEGFENFTENDKSNIISLINDLNSRNSKPFLSFTEDIVNHQKITFKMVDHSESDSKNGLNIAGQAYVQQETCVIELFPTAFENQILESVVWHELGHCAGLEHSPNPDDVMYYMVTPFSLYKETAIDKFIFDISKPLN